jgi:hypothetical protein
MRIHRPKGTVVLMKVSGAMMNSNSATDEGGEEVLLVSRFTLQDAADTVSVNLGVSSSEWKTIASSDDVSQPVEADAGDHGTITLMPPDRDDMMGGTKVEAHHQSIESPTQLIAIDNAGNEHRADNINVNNTNGNVVTSFTFNLAADQIKKVRFQVREFDKVVNVNDISLSRDHKTKPQISVQDAKK